MNRLKSIFIAFYPMVAMGIMGYASWRLYESRDVLAWVGTLLTVVPFVAFLSRVMLLKNVARTSGTFPGMNATAILGSTLSAYAAFVREPKGDLLAFTLAITGTIFFALYSLWYSRLGRGTSKLSLGSVLPDLELTGSNGLPFKLASLRGAPALVLFYRGNWCPLCMAQIKEIAARYREIRETGARIVLISPQPHDNTIALAKRFDVPFDFLTDTGNRVARALGLDMKNGLPMGMQMLGYESETVFPTVIVLDAKGIVRWLDQTDNYRIRPEPDTFLPLLRELVPAA